MMFNKRRRWFHSSRVKFPLVNISASWFLVSTYLIWILRPKLILWTNQSRATLWVLDTCLIVGLLPLMIILITASLSSKMYNWDSPWEECALVVTWSTCDNWSTSRFPFCLGLDVRSLSGSRRQFPAVGVVCGDLVLFDERNTSITTSHKSKAGNPSIRSPASNEIISDSLELWDTDVCFLHIQLVKDTNVRLPKVHISIPPEVDFESSKVPSKIWVLE